MVCNCRNNKYLFEDSAFYVIIINVDCQSNPGLSEMPLPSCVIFNTTFQGSIAVTWELMTPKVTLSSKILWLHESELFKFSQIDTSCSNKCQCLPVFSKTYIKAQNISPASGNLPMWRSWHLPTVSWSVFWLFQFLEPWSLEVFILRESVEMF